MKAKPLVSIIIVNWNGGVVFGECLDSLAKINYPNWELIVVDNASTDGSVQSLPDCHLIQNQKNLGFAQANNQGYGIAKGKYLLLLNNDTKVEPDFLVKLVDVLENNNEAAVVQPKILLMDKPDYLDSVGSFLTWTGFLQHVGYLKKDTQEYSHKQEIFSAKGACILIKKEIIDKVGLFDPDYVSYLEETDFCWRVWLAGNKILYYPRAVIYHKVGFTSKRLSQLSVNYHAFKNRLATLFKNLNFLNLLLIGSLHLILVSSLSFYYLLLLRPKEFVVIWRAVGWNLIHLPELIRKRRLVQKIIRRRSDRVIFNSIMQRFDSRAMFGHFFRFQRTLSDLHEV